MGKKNKNRRNKNRNRKLTLQFVPFSEIESLSSGERVKKLLDLTLENKLVLLQGKLKPEEENRLIEDTMLLIGKIADFKGIELAVLSGKSSKLPFFTLLRNNFVKLLIGDRDAITVIGPSSLVKEIKRDPSKLQLFLKR